MSEHALKTRPGLNALASRQPMAANDEERRAQFATSIQRDPLGQVSCRLGDRSCAGAHASALNRATTFSPANTTSAMLRLQRQYGNHYVQRVLGLSAHDFTRGDGAGTVRRSCPGCGGAYDREGKCSTCHTPRQPSTPTHPAIEHAIGDHEDSRGGSGVSSVELIPASPLPHAIPDSSGRASRHEAGTLTNDVFSISEVRVNRDGVPRKFSVSDLPGAWISRKMNWGRTACHMACWGLGGGLAAIVAAACAIGSTVTIGGLAIPCVYLVVGGAVAAGGLAALCSDACDQVIADNPSAQADADPEAPAVADESGRALSEETVEDVAETDVAETEVA